MLEKIRNKIAWICVTLIISGTLFLVLDFLGDFLMIFCGVLIFIFLFVPIEFFILPYKKESPTQRIFTFIRGICFLLLAIGTAFSLLNWPGASTILLLNIITSLVLVFTLWKKEKIVIKQPIIIVLLLIIAMTNLIELSQYVNFKKNNRNYKSSIIDLGILNNRAEIEFKFWSNQKPENKALITDSVSASVGKVDSLFLGASYQTAAGNYVDSLSTASSRDSLVTTTLNANTASNSIDTLLAINTAIHKIEKAEMKIIAIIAKTDFKSAKNLLKNPKKINTLTKTNFDDETFKSIFQEIDTSIFLALESIPLSNYFKEFRTIKLIIEYHNFGSDKFIFKDYNYLLDNPPQALIQLQLIKYLFLKEQIISFRKLNNIINKDIEEMERKELKIIFEENKYLIYNYIGETSKPDLKTKAFLKILLINYVLIFIMLYVPTLKILDKWKIRILLLALVFIFEFILLIVDDFLQIFSQNLLLLIAVNIVLAIGLVGLDGFLRRNFLKWYD
tara:strand:+ start:128 stop:1639 length:1512 start_codon:yes stop_codon:yes gene_type:complete